MSAAVWRILEFSADTVEILDLCVPPDKYTPSGKLTTITDIPFPRLTDITVNRYPFKDLRTIFAWPCSPLYPRLSRWHHTQPLNRYACQDMFESISQLAPSLELLRFSGITEESEFPRDLASALGLDYQGHDGRGSV